MLDQGVVTSESFSSTEAGSRSGFSSAMPTAGLGSYDLSGGRRLGPAVVMQSTAKAYHSHSTSAASDFELDTRLCLAC